MLFAENKHLCTLHKQGPLVTLYLHLGLTVPPKSTLQLKCVCNPGPTTLTFTKRIQRTSSVCPSTFQNKPQGMTASLSHHRFLLAWLVERGQYIHVPQLLLKLIFPKNVHNHLERAGSLQTTCNQIGLVCHSQWHDISGG